MEDPQTLARPDVVAANVTLFVGFRLFGMRAGQVRRTDDDYVVDHQRGGVKDMSPSTRSII